MKVQPFFILSVSFWYLAIAEASASKSQGKPQSHISVEPPGPTPSDHPQHSQDLAGALSMIDNLGFSPEDEAKCSFLNVEFKMPALHSVRSPKQINPDVVNIFWSIYQNECELCACNAKLQRLFFERMVWLDSRSDKSTLVSMNRFFREAYSLLYGPKAVYRALSSQRIRDIEAAIDNLFKRRMPLLEILYGNFFNPDMQGLNELIDFLALDIASLKLSPCTVDPKEKFLVDSLRSLQVIARRAKELTNWF
ncbi:hypothetical protein JCM33374_g1880 [Metschnikowia sp. JCM 33374]|nr:hypothetical protein JCM33374_g1880 [Metschnikowia sp. JCM 33374]